MNVVFESKKERLDEYSRILSVWNVKRECVREQKLFDFPS
jgi:hypothetical protein